MTDIIIIFFLYIWLNNIKTTKNLIKLNILQVNLLQINLGIIT